MYRITTDKGIYTSTDEDFVTSISELEQNGEKVTAASRISQDEPKQ